MQSVLLFDDIVKSSQKSVVKWNDFLDFLIENLSPKIDLPVTLNLRKIEDVPHVKVSIHIFLVYVYRKLGKENKIQGV